MKIYLEKIINQIFGKKMVKNQLMNNLELMDWKTKIL